MHQPNWRRTNPAFLLLQPSRDAHLFLDTTSFHSASARGGAPLERSRLPFLPLFFPSLHKNRHLLSRPLLPSPASFFFVTDSYPLCERNGILAVFPFGRQAPHNPKCPLSPNSFRISLRTASPSSHYDSRGTFGLSVEKYLPSLLATSPKICTDRGSGPDHSTTPSTPPPR